MLFRPRRVRTLIPIVAFLAAVGVYALVLKPDQPVQQTALPVDPPEPEIVYDEFGLEAERFEIAEREVKRGETFAAVMADFDIPYNYVLELVDASSDVFDVRRIRPGQEFRLYQDESGPRHLVYRQDPIRYVVFDLDGEPRAEAAERPVDLVERSISGVITNSLYQSLIDAGADAELANRLADVYAWSIDFYRIQKNDRFEVVFEERQIDGQKVGIEKILAARFNHFGEDHNAFYFSPDGERAEYYDEEGNSLRKAFLSAPLKYTRISSRYTKRRFHPINRRYQPHLGTDYAAPTGTPIYTVGDGVVTEAGFGRGNGNYVKIRHNGTYSTQYLHMSRIAGGMKPGRRVKQGEVIGYVGQTGLATGPHLCYRFWKNGQQVDPLKEQLPAADPIDPSLLAAFEQQRDVLIAKFDGASGDLLASTE